MTVPSYQSVCRPDWPDLRFPQPWLWAAEAAKLRAQGANLVDFGAGEPHFPTPAAY